MTGPILMCPYCGADGPRRCDFGDDEDDGFEDGDLICPWSESGEYADALQEYDDAMAEEGEDDDEGC